MASAKSSIDVAASPDTVWRLIGGFGSLPDWLPFIPKSELREGGRVRHLVAANGGLIVERLMAFDERARSYTYHILQSPFPVTDYYSTLAVAETAEGKTARVDWNGTFTPLGVDDSVAATIFQGIYDDALKELAQRFEQAST
jgi:hypothetical protein